MSEICSTIFEDYLSALRMWFTSTNCICFLVFLSLLRLGKHSASDSTKLLSIFVVDVTVILCFSIYIFIRFDIISSMRIKKILKLRTVAHFHGTFSRIYKSLWNFYSPAMRHGYRNYNSKIWNRSEIVYRDTRNRSQTRAWWKIGIQRE